MMDDAHAYIVFETDCLEDAYCFIEMCLTKVDHPALEHYWLRDHRPVLIPISSPNFNAKVVVGRYILHSDYVTWRKSRTQQPAGS